MSNNDLTIPVALSGRHVHLSREHVDALFGQGYELKWLSDLSQPGQYACQETIEVLGPKRSITKVRVLGPVRSATQVELSTTDGVVLGINLPTRDSGDVKGTPGAFLIGPKGAVKLQEGCIVAARHIHTTPEDAARFGVTDKQKVWVQVSGPRGLVFSDVLVRVSKDFATELHLDLDEGNAASIKNGDRVQILTNICNDLCELKHCGISSSLHADQAQPYCQFTSKGRTIR